MSFFENTRKPVGFGGEIMVAMMNFGHRALARWGMRFLTLPADGKVLDCGCGGGANIKKLLEKCPQGVVKGIDYSPVSVAKARELNEEAVNDGRCVISIARSLPKVLSVDRGSRSFLIQKPGCHVPQGLLHGARLICKAFRCCGMAEAAV